MNRTGRLVVTSRQNRPGAAEIHLSNHGGEAGGKGEVCDPVKPGEYQEQSQACREAQEKNAGLPTDPFPDPTKESDDEAPTKKKNQVGERDHPGKVPADLQRTEGRPANDMVACIDQSQLEEPGDQAEPDR